MRATLDWGYDLLPEPEAAMLRGLSVFANGWTLESAAAVLGAEDVLDTLTALIDKSLVRFDELGARYRMLETIREYAREKLSAAGEATEVHARFFAWCEAVAARAHGEGPGLGAALAADELGVEEDNLRAGLRWSIGERHEPERGLLLAIQLWRRWMPTGRWSEGRAWLEAALAAAPDAPAPVRARAVRCLSALAQEQGDFQYARTLLEATLAAQRERDETAEIIFTTFVLARVVERMGEYDRARGLLEEGLALARESGDRHMVAAELNSLGVSAHERGEYARAGELFAECLDLFREFEDVPNVAVVVHNLGELALRRGDLERAEVLLGESLATARAQGMSRLAAFSTHLIANAAAASGDYVRARTLFAEALAAHRDEGDRDGVAYVLEGLARMAVARGDAERALRLAGAAAGLRRSIGCMLPPFQQGDFDRALDAARSALGPEASASAEADGAAMPLDAAVAYALGE
jgi:tetratricopeptide (TPR) repeat protein